MLVRGLMFPLGRKQALAAQKMQELQPHLKEIQEKYKDDKERLTKETFALYKKHGVNPVGGCLPALIQLPIFVGLWQALNTSVPLRHATFLWIRDLAAPDMLFRFPFEVPFLGWTWFNLLPFVVVALMLVQTQALLAAGHDARGRAAAEDDEVHDGLHGGDVLQGPLGPGDLLHHEQPLGDRRAAAPAQDHACRPERRWPPRTRAKREATSRPVRRAARAAATAMDGARAAARARRAATASRASAQGRFAQFWERVLEEAQKDATYRKGDEERESKGRDGATRAPPAAEAMNVRPDDPGTKGKQVGRAFQPDSPAVSGRKGRPTLWPGSSPAPDGLSPPERL